MSFSSNDRVQICDSLYTDLTPVIKNCLKALCKSKVEKIGKNEKIEKIISYHSTSAEAERWLQLRIVFNCVCNGCIERTVSCLVLMLA